MTDRDPTIFAFPAGFLPSLQLLPNRMSKSMISLEFLAQGSREKNFQFFPGFSLCGRERKRRSCPRQRNAAAVLPPSRQPRPDHAAHRRGTACAAPAAWGFERTCATARAWCAFIGEPTLAAAGSNRSAMMLRQARAGYG